MFKIFTIGVLVYILYKLIFPAKGINSPGREHIKDKGEETIDIDYEEVE